MRMRQTAALLRQIYRIVKGLERMYPGRSFTPDGHMVGSIGEAWAAWIYDLELFKQSHRGHDARGSSGMLVQIKATQGKSIGISSKPNHLIVLRITPTGTPVEVYNGPGAFAWNAARAMQKNGQRPVGTGKLHKLMEKVPPSARISAANSVDPMG